MALRSAPSVENYTLGGGIVSAALWDGSTPPEEADYFDLGNAPAFGYTVSVTKYEHKSSRVGSLEIDKSLVREKGYTVTFTLDEPTQANLALFLKGTISGNYIYALENPNQEVAIRFESDNDYGENVILDFWRCSIDPNGEFNEISIEQAKEMKFTCTGLSDRANHPTNPWFRLTKVDITT